MWADTSNAEIKEAIGGVLETEFQVLVNAGISLGSMVAFAVLVCDTLMTVLWPAASNFGTLVALGCVLVGGRFLHRTRIRHRHEADAEPGQSGAGPSAYVGVRPTAR